MVDAASIVLTEYTSVSVLVDFQLREFEAVCKFFL